MDFRSSNSRNIRECFVLFFLFFVFLGFERELLYSRDVTRKRNVAKNPNITSKKGTGGKLLKAIPKLHLFLSPTNASTIKTTGCHRWDAFRLGISLGLFGTECVSTQQIEEP